MKAEPFRVVHRVVRPDQCVSGRLGPVDKAGQKESKGCAPGEHGQSDPFGGGERTKAFITGQKGASAGDVVLPPGFEGPGVQADGDVVGEEVRAGEIEVYDP